MMQKSKGKPSKPVNRYVYALLWSSGLAVLVWLYYLATPFLAQRLTRQQFEVLPYLVATLLLGLFQAVLTERLLKRSMRNWLVYTLLGTLTSLLWSDLFPWSALQTPRAFLSSIGWIWLPVFQMVWLWRRVRYAWLWPVAQVVLNLVMRLFPSFPGPLSSPLVILYSLPQQFVMGMVMYFLWSHGKTSEKAKVDADAAQDDEERLQRLQEPARHDDHWDTGDTQALHNKA